MAALSQQVISEFCDICNWAYKAWLFHITLFDENPRATELRKSNAAAALELLHTITHEYSLLQISKLHDHADTAGQLNLSIDYILSHGEWPDTVLYRLKALADLLNKFATGLRPARNKILSHTDLNTIVRHTVLGEFPQGEDRQYFSNLLEFANIVHNEACGGPCVFDDLVSTDVNDLLHMIKIESE